MARAPRKPKAEEPTIEVNHAEVVYDCVITLGNDAKALIAAIKNAPDQKPIKLSIYEARVVQSLDCSRAYAKEVVDNKHNDDKACVAALSAARSWVSRLYKTNNILTDETRGGANNPKGRKAGNDDDEMDDGDIKFPKSPKVTTRFELQAWVQAQAQTMVDFMALNEEHDTVACDHGHALWGACKDFLTSILEVGNQFASAKDK